MLQRAAALGFQELSVSSTAVGLTLPTGPQQAVATGCSLSGVVLTVGTVTSGAFAVGQIVTGTGIPANTTVAQQGSVPGVWNLSQVCSTESGETVTAYGGSIADFAEIRVATSGGAVNWRDDGTVPTSSSGVPMMAADPPLEYGGPLASWQCIAQTGTVSVAVSFYKLVG